MHPKKLGTSNIAPALIDIAIVNIYAANKGLLPDTKYIHSTTYKANIESLNRSWLISLISSLATSIMQTSWALKSSFLKYRKLSFPTRVMMTE